MLDEVSERSDIVRIMEEIGQRAKAASKQLALASSERKHAALIAMADALMRRQDVILNANALDVANARETGMSTAFIDRLQLDAGRIRAMADSLRAIADQGDPIGDVMASWRRPNGLIIERVRTPLGVIGVIYESRPNVTADAGALCLKAGNAVILRGGSDSLNSSNAIHAGLVEGLETAGLSRDAIQMVPTTDRAAVGLLLSGLGGSVDVIVPRGGRSLVERVQAEARVPVFAHLEGLNHVYVDKSADLDMAREITVNSKMRRVGICGAVETLLIDRAALQTHAAPLIAALQVAGCQTRGDRAVMAVASGMEPATESDWQSEYLDAIIAVRVVDGVEGAIDHIERYGSHHTDAIIAEDPAVVERFFREVDSAIILHNASTQFADGGEFGMGGEIGIATGRMHARGPVGVEQLTSFKYRVHGKGQTRP